MFLCAFDCATDIGKVNSGYCISVLHYIIRGLYTLYVQVNINFSADKQQKHLMHQHLKIILNIVIFTIVQCKNEKIFFPQKTKKFILFGLLEIIFKF